jgi:hypothetical protein
MREPSGAPAPAGVLFPELLADSEPAPPAQPHGSRFIKVLARVLLWSLITLGAVRGLMPVPPGPAPTSVVRAGSVPSVSAEPREHQQAGAVAAAFLREYLTVGEDRAARAQRLSQLTVRGLDLRRSVSVPAGVDQYADLVMPAGSRSIAGGVEVTVVAHVLQARPDGYRDGGMLAFVVPWPSSGQGSRLPVIRGPPLLPSGRCCHFPAHRPCRCPCRRWLDGWPTKRWSPSSPATRQPWPASEAAGRHQSAHLPPAGVP